MDIQKTPKGIAIYHRVKHDESFDDAAKHITALLRETQKRFPNVTRHLYVDIYGHRNKNKGFDKDMFELQLNFIVQHISQFVEFVSIPLVSFETNKKQRNDVPDELLIFNTKEEMNNHEGPIHEKWIGDIE